DVAHQYPARIGRYLDPARGRDFDVHLCRCGDRVRLQGHVSKAAGGNDGSGGENDWVDAWHVSLAVIVRCDGRAETLGAPCVTRMRMATGRARLHRTGYVCSAA